MLRTLVVRGAAMLDIILPPAACTHVPRSFSSQGQGHDAGAPVQQVDSRTEPAQAQGEQQQPSSAEPARRLRSFAEIFKEDTDSSHGPELVSDLVSDSLSQPSTSAPQQPDVAKEQRPGDKLVSPRFGYAAISGALPGDRPAAQHPRLHPKRLFMPGDIYTADELNPFSLSGSTSRGRYQQQRRRAAPPVHEVMHLADYKNVSFLEQFLTPAGKLMPRQVSKLPPALHARVVKEIKRARNLGFIAGEARPEKRHLRALREAQASLTQPV